METKYFCCFLCLDSFSSMILHRFIQDVACMSGFYLFVFTADLSMTAAYSV